MRFMPKGKLYRKKITLTKITLVLLA